MVKRKDGRYQEQVLNKITGKYKYFYGHSKSDVLNQITEYSIEQQKGMPFKDVADEWQAFSETQISYYTYDCYKAPLKDVKERFDNKCLNEIQPSNIHAYMLYLANNDLARQTIKLRLIVLNQIYKYAVGQGYIDYNPAAEIVLPKNLKKAKRELPCDSDIDAIKKHIDGKFGLLAYFILYTGCRRSEALAVKWSDIDFSTNTITIDKIVQFQHNKPIIINKTKSAAGMRQIPLLTCLKKELKKVKKSNGYVFDGENDLLTQKELRCGWDNLGLNTTLHQLRHSYATILFDAKIDMKTAQTLLGHSSISVTSDIYTHISDSHINGAKNKLNKFINK